jgi:hypothetical protein
MDLSRLISMTVGMYDHWYRVFCTCLPPLLGESAVHLALVTRVAAICFKTLILLDIQSSKKICVMCMSDLR